MSAAEAQEAANELGQPVGVSIGDWRAPPRPPRAPLSGRWCTLEPLDAQRHGAQLYSAVSADRRGGNWTYLGIGPFADEASFLAWVRSVCDGADPMFFAIIDTARGVAVGVASYLRIAPESGCIEVGHLHFSPLMQRTPIATEAMYLMMRQIFELGYRRYEWKCDSRNAPSRRAAQRFGFSYEGIFRQATVYKGRNRDTAWYAMIDTEWPALRAAYERWLSADNFDAQGRQRESLAALTRTLLHVPTPPTAAAPY